MVDRVMVGLDRPLHTQVKAMAEEDDRTFRATLTRLVTRGLEEERKDLEAQARMLNWAKEAA